MKNYKIDFDNHDQDIKRRVQEICFIHDKIWPCGGNTIQYLNERFLLIAKHITKCNEYTFMIIDYEQITPEDFIAEYGGCDTTQSISFKISKGVIKPIIETIARKFDVPLRMLLNEPDNFKEKDLLLHSLKPSIMKGNRSSYGDTEKRNQQKIDNYREDSKPEKDYQDRKKAAIVPEKKPAPIRILNDVNFDHRLGLWNK